MGRPSSGITKQQIVLAAIELADADGLEAVSMRAIAQRLSVTPMALYSRIGGKDELLDAMVAELTGGVRLPGPELDWRERLGALLRALRRSGQAHPAGPLLLLDRPVVSPAGHALTEVLLAALRHAGLDDRRILQFETLISTWLLGFLVSESNGRFGPGSIPVDQRLAALPPDEFPEHHRIAEPLANRDWDQEFERSVETLITAVELASNSSGRSLENP